MNRDTRFNKVVAWAVNGIVVDGLKRRTLPMHYGVDKNKKLAGPPTKKGESWIYGECPKCGDKCGVVFYTEDGQYFVLLCLHCGKTTPKKVGEKEKETTTITPSKDVCRCLTKKHTPCKNNPSQQGICRHHLEMIKNGVVVVDHDNNPIKLSF